MDISFLFMMVGVFLPFFLLYQRKKKWLTDKIRWWICGVIFMIGLIGFIFEGQNAFKKGYLFLFLPVIYNFFDRWFKSISQRKWGRDFYLYLRGSNEIDEGMWAENPHLKPSDKFFSLTLLFLIYVLIISSALISNRL